MTALQCHVEEREELGKLEVNVKKIKVRKRKELDRDRKERGRKRERDRERFGGEERGERKGWRSGEKWRNIGRV